MSSRRNRLKTYGMTPEEYDSLLESQGGRCAICFTDKNGSRSTFCVDHNHKTGAVRALLCHACNFGIGHMRDDPERLRRAADYLESHDQKELNPV